MYDISLDNCLEAWQLYNIAYLSEDYWVAGRDTAILWERDLEYLLMEFLHSISYKTEVQELLLDELHSYYLVAADPYAQLIQKGNICWLGEPKNITFWILREPDLEDPNAVIC